MERVRVGKLTKSRKIADPFFIFSCHVCYGLPARPFGVFELHARHAAQQRRLHAGVERVRSSRHMCHGSMPMAYAWPRRSATVATHLRFVGELGSHVRL